MNIKGLSRIATIIICLFLLVGCQLNPQSAKEKMAYNNTMNEIKAMNYMDGKIGNVKFSKNGYIGFTFDFTDANLKQEEMEDICYKLLAVYANSNNRAQTGITVIRITGHKSGGGTVKATYQAGPTKGDDIRTNVKISWE